MFSIFYKLYYSILFQFENVMMSRSRLLFCEVPAQSKEAIYSVVPVIQA